MTTNARNATAKACTGDLLPTKLGKMAATACTRVSAAHLNSALMIHKINQV